MPKFYASSAFFLQEKRGNTANSYRYKKSLRPERANGRGKGGVIMAISSIGMAINNYTNNYAGANYYAKEIDGEEQVAGYGKPTDPIKRIEGLEDEDPAAVYDKDKQKKPGYKSSPEECETCKERKYQDGSDEMVSFKTPGHIAPQNSAAMVLSHEREHVTNAFQKAAQNNGKVERVSVRLKSAICPECGRTYISGGVTNTQIKYYNEDNPYQKDMKESDAVNKYRGMNVDVAA